jgi:hypothetical protein
MNLIVAIGTFSLSRDTAFLHDYKVTSLVVALHFGPNTPPSNLPVTNNILTSVNMYRFTHIMLCQEPRIRNLA